jgi:hypothetical protein
VPVGQVGPQDMSFQASGGWGKEVVGEGIASLIVVDDVGAVFVPKPNGCLGGEEVEDRGADVAGGGREGGGGRG